MKGQFFCKSDIKNKLSVVRELVQGLMGLMG
jgi:hypothetical protein